MAAVCLAASAAAQVNTATVSGIVADESKAVLPGVTVTAADKETGRKYVAVTDERGSYRLSLLPPGIYKIQADLSGFAPAEVPTVELLVGQSATLPFTLKISVVRENVTVTGEAPLIDVTSTQVAGNVDRRQMEAMPLQGRNWLELSMLVKGITANNMTNNPGISQNESFNLNHRDRGSRTSAAKPLPNSRSSPISSTSRRAGRPACRSRRFPSPAPTTSPESDTDSFAAIRSTRQIRWR
jgi:hypothetical protein